MLQAAPVGEQYETVADIALTKYPSFIASKARVGAPNTTLQEEIATVVTYSVVSDALVNIHSVNRVLVPTTKPGH